MTGLKDSTSITIKVVDSSADAFSGKPCFIPNFGIKIMKATVGAEDGIVWEHVL